MEAWHFFDYINGVSPTFSLSVTAERWGLEPFPANLVAIHGSLSDIEKSNKSEPAWPLPYSCSSDLATSYDHDYSDSIYVDSNSITNINGSSKICANPKPCTVSGCLIVVEEIGKTTVGPAHSNIIALSHCFSLFIALFLTFAIIMGCSSSKFEPEPPPPTKRLEPTQLEKYANRPARRSQKYGKQRSSPADMGREVARCSDLLRQMYGLDLIIWSMEDSVPDEIPRREEMKRKANALFAEICRVVHGWKSMDGSRWTAEERRNIDKICALVDQHDMRRY